MSYPFVLCACDECPENNNCKRYVLYNMDENTKNELNNSGQLISKNIYKQYCSVDNYKYKLKMKLDNDTNINNTNNTKESDSNV